MIVSIKPADIKNENELIQLKLKRYFHEKTVTEFCNEMLSFDRTGLYHVLRDVEEFLNGSRDNVVALAVFFKLLPSLM